MQTVRLFSWLCLWLSPVTHNKQDLIAHFQQAEPQAWIALIQLSSEHLVTPALYPLAVSKELLVYIPADVLDYLKNVHQLNTQRNQALLKQSLDIIDTLNAVDIQPLALKGIASLLSPLYPDIGMRVLGDIDLLIPKTRLADALTALRARGYVEAEDNILDAYQAHHHAVPLIKAGALASVELHHELIPVYAQSSLLTSADCWQHAIALPLAQRQCYLLAIDDRLLHNFYHSQLGDRNYLRGKVSPRQALEWLYLYNNYTEQIDFTACVERVRQAHLLTALVAYQLSIEHYFKQTTSALLTITLVGRLQYWRERLKRQSSGFARVDDGLVAMMMGFSYLRQFSAAALSLRYPHLPLSVARKLWLQKLKTRL